MINSRIGTGFDAHSVSFELMGLYLGGVFIENSFSLIGNSEGDVLLHALSNSLLATVESLDIGEFLRNKKERNSEIILQKILLYLHKRMVKIVNSSIIIIASPDIMNISKYKKEITNNLEYLIKSPVTITANSANGFFPATKNAIACYATTLITYI